MPLPVGGNPAIVAAVVTLMVTLALLPPGVTLDGENEHELCAGSPEHENRMALSKEPPTGASESVRVPVWPRATDNRVALALNVKSVTTTTKDTLWLSCARASLVVIVPE